MIVADVAAVRLGMLELLPRRAVRREHQHDGREPQQREQRKPAAPSATHHPFASVLFVERKRRECEVQTEEINVLANPMLPVLVRTKYKKERV